MPKQILIVVHQEQSTPGRVGIKLERLGYTLDIRRPCLGQPLPDTLEEHAGVVVFGGPMSANDDQDLQFIRREIDWLALPLRQSVPYLGICLGAQLLARHLGAKVEQHPQGSAEIGYYPIEPTKAGQSIGPWPSHVYQWHREGFEPPNGARLLATAPGAFLNQAYSFNDTAFAIQFHPEVTLAMMHRWTVRAAHRFVLPNVRPRHTHFADRMVYDPAVDHWLDHMLGHWLASGKRQSATRAA
jgi:GMP synthase (glutamine-hydrolysing)